MATPATDRRGSGFVVGSAAMTLSDPEITACEQIAAILRTVAPHRRPDVLQAAVALLQGHAAPHRPVGPRDDSPTARLARRPRRPG